MKNINNTLQVVKSLKLSFDSLGYAVVNGAITKDRSVYRNLLRSGKSDLKRMCSSDREFQVNTFYKYYFDNKIYPFRCDYRESVFFCLTRETIEHTYHKAIQQVTNRLLSIGCFELFTLPDGKLLKDKVNKVEFYYSNHDLKVYRLVNGKAVAYKVT